MKLKASDSMPQAKLCHSKALVLRTSSAVSLLTITVTINVKRVTQRHGAKHLFADLPHLRGHCERGWRNGNENRDA